MEPYVFVVDDLSFPALLVHPNGWVVWRDVRQAMADPRLLRLRGDDRTILPGRRVQAWLVDASGTMHDIVEVEDARVDIMRLPRAERVRAIESGGKAGTVRLVCAGSSRPATIEDVVNRIAWLVSARGHFENPGGFGLRADVASAYTFPDLFDALGRQQW